MKKKKFNLFEINEQSKFINMIIRLLFINVYRTSTST